MAIELTGEGYEDPIEAAYQAERRLNRRRVLAVSLALSLTVLSYLGWKAGRHLTASWWLRANGHSVSWGIDPGNRNLGGGTTVRFVPSYWGIGSKTDRNAGLKYLLMLHRVEELDLSLAFQLTDDEVAIIDQLPALHRLNLDRSLRNISINFDNPGLLTDVTLGRIKQLANLEELNLNGQPISDAGLANLTGLSKLQDLEVVKTPITDAGLEHLRAIPRLKSLDIRGTKITNQAIQAFEAARPEVKVVDDSTP